MSSATRRAHARARGLKLEMARKEHTPNVAAHAPASFETQSTGNGCSQRSRAHARARGLKLLIAISPAARGSSI